MYEKIKTYLETLKSKVTMQRLIVGAICVLFLYGISSLASGYFTARANYNRAIERLEQTQRALDDSRRLNRELNKLIETSRQLNNDAGDRIKRIEDYQQREGESLNRIEGNQRETGARVRESLEQNNRARGEIKSSLELIRRIEERNQEQ
jgi:biopolymer transport protein ExbB/TolQ